MINQYLDYLDLEKYKAVLEACKKNAIAEFLKIMSDKAYAMIKSEHASPQIAPYFQNINNNETKLILCKYEFQTLHRSFLKLNQLITQYRQQSSDRLTLNELNEQTKNELKTLHEELHPYLIYLVPIDQRVNVQRLDHYLTDFLELKEANADDQLTDKQFTELMEEGNNNLLEIQHYWNGYHYDLTKRRFLTAEETQAFLQKEIPFSNFDNEPDNISQIKKLINALYYARKTFMDLELIDLQGNLGNLFDLYTLYKDTIESAYQASYLATHLDIDLYDLFRAELDFILPQLAKVQEFAYNYSHEQSKKIKINPLSYKVGEISGITADQMRPIGKDVDYNLLTSVGASLPDYLSKLTKSIKEYSSQIKEHEPTLNQEKLDELRDISVHLLNDIQQLQGNNLFVPLKLLNYIHIINNIITLSKNTLAQAGHLTESSQDLVRDKLAQLKYDLLPQLFGLVDKIEVNAMLKPGTLSTPLMEKVKELYDAVLFLPRKAIDFETKGAELLSIEDSQFIELRLELAYKRIDKANKILYKNQKVKDAAKEFFNRLSQKEFQNSSLNQLSTKTKEKLIQHYKIIKPYMERINPHLSDIIISSLLSSENESNKSRLGSFRDWLSGSLSEDHITVITEQQSSLENLLTKEVDSQLFHIRLNKELIRFVQTESDLILCPYSNKTNVYILDEALALDIDVNETKFTFDHHEFDALHHSFPKLNQLITQYKTQPNEQAKNELKALHPYLIYLVPIDQKANARRLTHYLTDLLAQKETDASNQLTNEQFTELMEKGNNHLLEIKCHWNNNSHYDLTKKRFLTAEEAQTFIQIEKLKKQFIQENGYFVLAENTEEMLTADQALQLREWYRDKDNKLAGIQKKYAGFKVLLRTNNVLENLLLIGSLTEETKEKLRRSYCTLQNYFIDVIPLEDRQQALEFDRSLVALLTNKTLEDPQTAPTYVAFQNLDGLFQQFFSQAKKDLHKNFQKYSSLTERKFISENNEAKLTPSINNERAQYLLKHTNLSKSVNNFRTALGKMVQLFNEPMREELKPQADGIPYPEMEDPNTLLSQCKQVRAIKDIYNGLFHLEGIAIELEKLPDENLNSSSSNSLSVKTQKGRYVYYLFQEYNHIIQIKELSKRLVDDPHARLITQELMRKAHALYAAFQGQTGEYQIDSDQIDVPGKVQYNSIWYTLNAFYISPKHIRALNNTNYLTAKELDHLHQRAKNATLIIEELIRNSNSHFKLFLQSPNMLILYKELKQKLNEFSTTGRDAVLNNLDKIRSTVFTPMLKEADLWERELGLVPGSLSEPLRGITNEYFKGLLHSLKLDSQKHIDLVCDSKPLEQRIAVVTQNINEIRAQQEEETQYFAEISILHQLMQEYKRLMQGYKHFDDVPEKVVSLETRIRYKQNITQTYKAVLPKLCKLIQAQQVNIAPSTNEKDHLFDALCNKDLIKERKPLFTEIEALVTASHHYGLGVQATLHMQLNIETASSDYLTQLIQTEQREKVIFIDEYAQEVFAKQLNNACTHHPEALFYTGVEYTNILKTYLLDSKELIINRAKEAQAQKKDITESIKAQLREHISAFEKLHSVINALNKLRKYITEAKSTNPPFESAETIRNKDQVVLNLETIAQNTNLSIQERLERLRNEIHKRSEVIINEDGQESKPKQSFEEVILAHRTPALFTLDYLKACLYDLLEALHLYTPKRVQLYNNVKNAMDEPVLNRFSLFSKPIAEKPSLRKHKTVVPEAQEPAVEPDAAAANGPAV
ncbi:MAG: hypothetical protein QM652_04035 [Legionella sp.]|uniref:hypothetical protein n=1 Tax=Legionella sp. TaxID=459 RepID=UPI0039E64924